VWYQRRFDGDALTYDRAAPLIEDDYSVTDAVVVGSLLVSLLRHAGRVEIACLAQLVNVIAPIRTEVLGPAWRQSIFHPFAATARHARGDVLLALVDAPVHDTDRYGEVSALDAVATLDDETGALAVILVNRSPTQALGTRVVLRGFVSVDVVERLQLWDDDPDATNSATRPDRVRIHAGEPVSRDDDALVLSLPPASWTMLRATVAGVGT
jgi:alpha-L-arabinofuranosidase